MPSYFKGNENVIMDILQEQIRPKDLFLTNGFKNFISSQLVEYIRQWAISKFIVIYRADTVESRRVIIDKKDGDNIFIDTAINEGAKRFGIHSNALIYHSSKEENHMRLYSAFRDRENENSVNIIPAEIFESYGTIRFTNIFPMILEAFSKGQTLVLDEFDANIHPMALMSIIQMFHDENINKKNAQLIFNTHNPVFLNRNVFRRDEIKFVERNEETGNSEHYALSDFKTSGVGGVRKEHDYMNHYFLGRYGAIQNIQLYDIVEDMLKQSEGDIVDE